MPSWFPRRAHWAFYTNGVCLSERFLHVILHLMQFPPMLRLPCIRSTEVISKKTCPSTKMLHLSGLVGQHSLGWLCGPLGLIWTKIQAAPAFFIWPRVVEEITYSLKWSMCSRGIDFCINCFGWGYLGPLFNTPPPSLHFHCCQLASKQPFCLTHFTILLHFACYAPCLFLVVCSMKDTVYE